ncbi:MAG: hypothetical protein IKN98_04290 [Bacteroidales bacterium]|nr:hypothetical protein [Bacteroidales bacterium]
MPTTSIQNGDTLLLNSSKSILIRQLVVEALYGEVLPMPNADDSEDVWVVFHALNIIKQNINKSLQNIDNNFITIDVKDCGAGYRFMMAVAAVTPGRWLLTGTKRLLERPILPLVNALKSAGADIEPCAEGWKIRGKKLHARALTIDCAQSSQLASALLLVGDRLGLQELTVVPTPPPSAPYWELTRRMVEARRQGLPVMREADWSTAAFWYAFLAANITIDTLTLKDLHLDTLQGDAVVAEWFRGFGIRSEQTAEGVKISRVTIDCNPVENNTFHLYNHPDLAPVMAVTAVLCQRMVTLTGLGNLNRKESRRMDLLCELLSHFCSLQRQDDETLTVDGTSFITNSKPITFDPQNDHRMAMAAALLSLHFPIVVTDIDCVKKSYPQFQKYFISDPKNQK